MHVAEANVPYYLFHTRDCTFRGCTIGNQPVPLHPEESKQRQSCDVW